MRLLWIPHTRWSPGVGHRAQYLINRLKERHELHVITWSEPQTPSPLDFADPAIHLRALIPGNVIDDGIMLHHVPRWCFHRLPYLWRRNQHILNEAVRKIVRDHGIEAIIFGPSAYLVGYPPTGTGASLIFDYVDYTRDEILQEYLGRAEAVICASRRLQKQVLALKRDAIYLPNGVDVERLRRADGSQIRADYRLEDRLVISLIGLTCSPDLYFVDSLEHVSNRFPNAVFLFVGMGPLYKSLRRALRGIRSRCIWTGWIPQERIYDFFMASDIGLYPGGNNEYFRSACPIKLLEYAASGKPSASSPVEEIDTLGLRSVVQVDENAEAFSSGIMRAMSWTSLDDPSKVPSWEKIAIRFENVHKGGWSEEST